jgi:adenylylsulfate kinase-like enzyme
MIGEWWLCCAHMKSSLAGQKQSRTQPFSQLLHAAISHDCYVRAVCATISMTAKDRRTQPFSQLLHATILHDSYVRAVCATISMTAKNRRTQPFRQLLHATIIHDSYVRAVCATISMTAAPQNCSRRLPRTSLFFTAISHTHTHTLASVSEVQCWK